MRIECIGKTSDVDAGPCLMVLQNTRIAMTCLWHVEYYTMTRAAFTCLNRISPSEMLNNAKAVIDRVSVVYCTSAVKIRKPGMAWAAVC